MIRIDAKSKRAVISIMNMDRYFKRGMAGAMRDVGRMLVKDAKLEIRDREKKTGIVYRLGSKKRGVVHRASARGQYPASLTGLLANSVSYDVKSGNQLYFGDKVASRPDADAPLAAKRLKRIMNYGKYLEDGVDKRKTGALAARPHLIPTIRKNEKNIETYFQNRIRESVSRGAKV